MNVHASPYKPAIFLQLYALTKPRVVQLIVFCALIGMVLAVPGFPSEQEILRGFLASLGIWLVASAAAVFNCFIEKGIDAKMKRTAWRATAKGEFIDSQILFFSLVLFVTGSVLLYVWVNPLTMWLTFATFVGYAVIYTIILKPRTPQNIVIGGLSGAMPPALGWAAVADAVPAEAWLLVLIIFIWTPPHFWALALYRTNDYAKSGLPMLPITHGQQFTRLHILLYSIALLATTLLPYVVGMSGWLYLIAAVILGLMFVHYAYKLYRAYSDELSRKLFRFSILYLSLLFAALLADHWLIMVPR